MLKQIHTLYAIQYSINKNIIGTRSKIDMRDGTNDLLTIGFGAIIFIHYRAF